METTKINAFGVVLDSDRLKENFVPFLCTHLMTSERYEEYINYCKDENLEPGDDKSFYLYAGYDCGDYAYETMTCLVHILNEKNNLTLDINKLQYYDYCVYYENLVPANEEERKLILTKEQVQKLIADFFKPIVKENTPLWCESLDIDY